MANKKKPGRMTATQLTTHEQIAIVSRILNSTRICAKSRGTVQTAAEIVAKVGGAKALAYRDFRRMVDTSYSLHLRLELLIFKSKILKLDC